MPIKEKSVFKKHEYEYESPDGDLYSVTYVECEGKEYVEIARQKPDGGTEDKVVWDFGMFKEVTQILDKIKFGNQTQPVMMPQRGLMAPNIIDHRGSRAFRIEQSVNQSMDRYDDSVSPVQSFDGQRERDAWEVNATGIDRKAQGQVSNTPEDISIADKGEDELAPWQQDALVRGKARLPFSPDQNKAIRGSGGRRVGAKDLM